MIKKTKYYKKQNCRLIGNQQFYPKKILRRERDSNPRTGEPVNGFRDRPIRPLWHLS